MPPPTQLISLLLIFISFTTITTTTTAHRHHSHPAPSSSDLVRSSCIHANYPDLCLRTLSPFSSHPYPLTPRALALAALNVSLSRASAASRFLSSASSPSPRGRSALSDCVDQISDSIDDLSKALSEISHLRTGGQSFRWQMSNAQTWVSAALTNEDTCLDGFQGVASSHLKSAVRKHVTDVARVTSNALYMINRLDESRRQPATTTPP